MIPVDITNRLRFTQPDLPESTQPVSATQKVADALSDLVPGQRVLAEIQTLLPNGTYRATVAQRDVTLALPFSAKAGDTLELEVVDNNGKIALAFVANRSAGESAGKAPESVATTLSQAGRMIGDLMGNIAEPGKRAAPAPLNGNQPLVSQFPAQAADLTPILQDALTKSGVFYEAHQAKWIAGELPAEQLREEPQGKLAPTSLPAVDRNFDPKSETVRPDSANNPAQSAAAAARSDAPMLGGVPRDVAPIVQQQLDALASQNYAWQGQIWPNQSMSWEIAEDGSQQRMGDDASSAWRTRLKLSLPNLGGIDAVLQFRPGGEIALTLTTNSDGSEQTLRDNLQTLCQQFEAAALNLTQASIQHGEITE